MFACCCETIAKHINLYHRRVASARCFLSSVDDLFLIAVRRQCSSDILSHSMFVYGLIQVLSVHIEKYAQSAQEGVDSW